MLFRPIPGYPERLQIGEKRVPSVIFGALVSRNERNR
jgi:hypothetical protein